MSDQIKILMALFGRRFCGRQQSVDIATLFPPYTQLLGQYSKWRSPSPKKYFCLLKLIFGMKTLQNQDEMLEIAEEIQTKCKHCY